MKPVTPIWKIEQAIRLLDKEIEELQARKRRLLLTLTKAKENPSQ
jgi:hypothetical protein